MKVTIVTPTTGSPFLSECIESVRNQTYKNIEHLVFVDGRSRFEKADAVTKPIEFPNGINEHLCVLPYPTGINRYNGHRIYGASAFLSDGDYHVWLDDDNRFAPDHIESLVDLVKSKNLSWAYSFRKIIDKDGNFVCYDDCESLGMWPSILHPEDKFIDVNCYMVKKELAIGISKIWYRQFRVEGQMEVDRAIASTLMDNRNNLKFDCTRNYSVEYRTGNTDLSVKTEFFTRGNQAMLQRHNGVLPWKQ